MNIAGVGLGDMGPGNLRNLESENIVALCDVDPTNAAKTRERYSGAKFYTDYREMLDRQHDIDGLVIATPDHTHAVIAMDAIRAGKHVYCQKPLTHDVYEARMLAKAARESKVTTQMGIQGHSGEGIRQTCEWIWSGQIGEVREVDAWCSLTYYPWGHAWWSSQWADRPKEAMPVARGNELGRVDRPRPDAALPSCVSPFHLAVLVGFRLRDDGRSRGAHARLRRHRAQARRALERRRHLLRFDQGSSSAGGRGHVPVPGPRLPPRREAQLVRGDAAAPAGGPRGRREACRRRAARSSRGPGARS